jgi:hypothetical protein
MSLKPEPYYDFLTRDEAVSDARLRALRMPDTFKAPLLAAHRLVAEHLDILEVEHVWKGQLRIGQLVVHDVMRDRFEYMFGYMKDAGLEIEKLIPAAKYRDDRAQMVANASMAWRVDYNGKPERGVFSKHLLCAVDVNQGHNAQKDKDGTYHPSYANPAHPKYRPPYGPAVIANYPDMLMDFSANLNMEHGSFWNDPDIEQKTGYPDYYPGAPFDLHHWELRDSGKGDELCMQNFPMPDGLVYVPTGKIMLA